MLLEEFLEPLEVTQHRLAVSIGVPPRRINEIVHGKRRITADTALRLARYFGTTDRFWSSMASAASSMTSLRRAVRSMRGSNFLVRCRDQIRSVVASPNDLITN